jgi:hypothetical protein
MFSELDNIIFPDSCEVIEIVPSQHYVYPIFKNGSSSLHETQILTEWNSFFNNEITNITCPITVYLRDPRDRFVSGVNTFIQHCHRDFNNLDTDTILHFVKHYLFLNRHYTPQFFWLINLARYSTAPLILQNLDSIDQIVNINDSAGIAPPTKDLLDKIKDFPWQKLELYFLLDQLLVDRVGQTVTFQQLTTEIKQQHSDLYNLIFQKTSTLINALPKT